MPEDLRDELMRVKARESRYKKQAEERIAALEAELAVTREKLAASENDAEARLAALNEQNSSLRTNLEEARQMAAKDEIENATLINRLKKEKIGLEAALKIFTELLRN